MNTVHANIRELDDRETTEVGGAAFPPNMYGYIPGSQKPVPPPLPKPPGYTS